MVWHDRIYFNKDIKNKRKIIKNIKNNKLQFSAFVITLPVGNDGILELYPSYVLLQPAYKNLDLYIVGIADSRKKALNLMSSIILECYKKTNSFNVSEYIKNGVAK
ncbi:MAG: hypothetical protein J6L69_05630 [Lachnospiraceae bacterium]|nr:hypothetical protein [Lachnospiraceae bacterium]